MKKLQKIVMVVATLTLVATTQASPTDELIDGGCLKLLSKEAQQVDDLNCNRRKIEDQVQKLKTRPSADVNTNIIVELENRVRIIKMKSGGDGNKGEMHAGLWYQVMLHHALRSSRNNENSSL